jgi:uncharacterized protein (DUF362 family)
VTQIFLHSLDRGYLNAMAEGFAWTGIESTIRSSKSIFIKPNLTFPTFREGVMTNPEALESLIVYLKDFSCEITICESDSGGYNPFPMDEVFRATGISEMAERYGVRIVNLSYAPSRPICFLYRRREMSVPLPVCILDEADLFITMPVPKVHLNTVYSGAIKNQWGIIQEPDLRLKLYPYFREVVYRVNKGLPESVAVVDGMYGLNRSGPLRGDAVRLNWMLICDDIFKADWVASRLLGFEIDEIPYLTHILQKEGLQSLKDDEFNEDFTKYQSEKYYLKRLWTDLPGWLTFHSPFLAYIGYESVLARPLHWLLYRFREPFY